MKFETKERIVQEIRELMKDEGFNVSSIARASGQSRQNIHKMFKSEAELRFIDVVRLLESMGYELHYEFVRKGGSPESE